MQMGRKAKDETHRHNHLKFMVGFNGSIPEKVKFYDQATDAADDVPLKEVIFKMAFPVKTLPFLTEDSKVVKPLKNLPR